MLKACRADTITSHFRDGGGEVITLISRSPVRAICGFQSSQKLDRQEKSCFCSPVRAMCTRTKRSETGVKGLRIKLMPHGPVNAICRSKRGQGLDPERKSSNFCNPAKAICTQKRAETEENGEVFELILQSHLHKHKEIRSRIANEIVSLLI